MNTRTSTLFPLRRLLAIPLALGLLALPLSAAVAATHVAESRGISEPPFLSYGVKSNLLLLLDNSGSMLDMAYVDKDVDGTAGTADKATQCFDSGFLVDQTTGAQNAALESAGLFKVIDDQKAKVWYKWNNDGTNIVQPWKKATLYTPPALVTFEGIVYRALTSGTSTGIGATTDTAVDWEPVLQPRWQDGRWYHTNSFVFTTTLKVYRSTSSGTSKGTVATLEDPTTDSGVNWSLVPRYVNGASYAAGAYVLGENLQLFVTATGGIAKGESPTEDTVVKWSAVDPFAWKKGVVYAQGEVATHAGLTFISKAQHTASGDSIYEDTFATNWQRIDEGRFSPLTETDARTFCSGAAGTKHSGADVCATVDSSTGVQTVTAFAASGNFLNWATASKLDIQKKILTGGKYSEEEQLLIGESRGCAGNRFVKQYRLTEGTAVTSDDKQLTLSIRQEAGDGEAGEADDTTRLELFAITQNGMNFDQCQNAIEQFQDPSGVGPAEAAVAACVGFDSGSGNTANVEHIVYHKAIQECWYYAKHKKWKGGNDHPLKTCPQIYQSGVDPLGISPFDSSYVCYGVYDAGPHDKREGFVGRCWETTPPPATGTCKLKLCSKTCTLPPCYFQTGTTWYRCLADGTQEYCAGNYQSNQKTCKLNGIDRWTDMWEDTLTHNACTPPASTTPSTDYWSANLDGDPSVTTAPEPAALSVGEKCVDQAMHDFCLQTTTPEVIDPSDAATTTSEYWNLPAMLVDTGLAGQLGGKPLATMKLYIEQTTKPEGILHKTAGELRIGAMTFNNVGSVTECSGTNASDSILKYCTADNKDGAKLISEIKLGSAVTDAGDPLITTDDRTHVDDLATAINAVRATSWTPLAEALYNAIGYYTQNPAMRINKDDFPITSDAPVDPNRDPVTDWCQSNNILLITEGASTADINAQVKAFVEGTTIVDDNDTEIGKCTDGLDGSTYLDDLTHHGQHATAAELYPTGQSQLKNLDGEWKDKQNITTYIVASGDLRGKPTDPECTPARLITDAASNGGTSLYESTSPEALEQDLLEIFNSLRQRSSSGSAASVISSARGGEGAIYQAIFWPEIKRNGTQPSAANPSVQETKEYSVAWTGDVHALFVDARGYMYEDTIKDARMQPSEDTNNNGTLDPDEDVNGNTTLDLGDKRVIIYFDEVSGKSKACYNTANWLGTCPDTPVDLHEVRFVWSAGEWLSDPGLDATSNRTAYLSNAQKRYIFTWNDLDNDGIVDRQVGDNEWLPFEAYTPSTPFINWAALSVDPSRNPVPVDFDVVTIPATLPLPAATQTTLNKKVNDIVNWVRGNDRLLATDLNGNMATTDDGEAPRRSRQLPPSEGSSAPTITARLGDVIHSTPMTVSSPAEGYHLIYNDFSYAEFVKQYKNRRHVIYFGGNDGMLHAVNGGFYDEKQKKFCTGATYDSNGLCQDDPTKPALGAELWAYVPYNLLPHLGSLTQSDYKHKYFVDLRPRIFDAQIFANDADHPNGWGTILVGGMRLGGAPIGVQELNGASLVLNDNRQFISASFIFDITNPEKPPVLLGEMTRRSGATDTDLGHSLAIPTMVVMKKSGAATQTGSNKWYLLFGSGPHAPVGSNTAMKGISDQKAKVAVLPLDWLVKTPTALRIPAAAPTAGNPGGTFELIDSPTGFTSDLITVDLDINPSSASYYSDAVYFGTVEGNFAAKTVGTSTYTYWDGGGRAYRLITRNQVSGDYLYGKSVAATPTSTTPDQWTMTTLINVGQPVSAAPNVGYDGDNFWVYFGTGRFFDVNDKTDDTQHSFYGIKEPMEPTLTAGVKEWLASTVVAPATAAHGAPPTPPAPRTWPTATAAPGAKGLLKVDEIRVAEAGTADPNRLSCRDGGTDCLPPSMVSANTTKFADLVNYTAMPDPAGGDPNKLYNSADGWYVDFYPYGNRERNVGQATLFGGLVTFTTYQPYLDACQAEGKAYL